jgi:hypothetical protein
MTPVTSSYVIRPLVFGKKKDEKVCPNSMNPILVSRTIAPVVVSTTLSERSSFSPCFSIQDKMKVTQSNPHHDGNQEKMNGSASAAVAPDRGFPHARSEHQHSSSPQNHFRNAPFQGFWHCSLTGRNREIHIAIVPLLAPSLAGN